MPLNCFSVLYAEKFNQLGRERKKMVFERRGILVNSIDLASTPNFERRMTIICYLTLG